MSAVEMARFGPEAKMRSRGARTRAGAALACLLAMSCTEGGASTSLEEGRSRDSDASTPRLCDEPNEGCSCEPATEPETCYLEPIAQNGVLICNVGTRYCRDGAWGGCESVHAFALPTRAALIDGPSECNPCNPDCSVSNDAPTDADLTPENSSGVVYDSGSGGIILETMGMGSVLTDTDGDGVPDDADDCPAIAGEEAWLGCPAGANPNITEPGFFHILPFGGPSEIDPLEFDVQVTTADIYFLMDTTGSMGGEINNLRTSLTSGTFNGCTGGVIGAIQCSIPRANFGVGKFEDYATGGYGSSSWGDVPYTHMLNITDSVSATQTSVNALFTRNGNDWPESHTQALWSMVTGLGLNGFTSDSPGCTGNRWGYPCFREDTIPIVILFTDAPMHNGPNTAYDYVGIGGGGGGSYQDDPVCVAAVCAVDSWCCDVGWDSICESLAGSTPECAGAGGAVSPTWAEATAALNSRDVRVITVESSGGYSDGQANAVALGNATSSVNSSGNPYVFSIPTDGSGLSTAVVDAVEELATNTRFDVTAVAVDNPATPAFDETGLVVSISATTWSNGSCTGTAGDTFLQCRPGTDVDFSVEFRNDIVMPTAVAQVFDFEIAVLLDGTTQQTVPVRIVVPPEVPTFPPSGSYWRNYDATVRCEIPPERPDWGALSWVSQTPSTTSIQFELRTAATNADLDSASPVTFTVPGTASPVDVGSALIAGGSENFLPYLRVTAVLQSSADMAQTPVLTSFQLQYVCEDQE